MVGCTGPGMPIKEFPNYKVVLEDYVPTDQYQLYREQTQEQNNRCASNDSLVAFDPKDIIKEVEEIESILEKNPNYRIQNKKLYFAKKAYVDILKEGYSLRHFDPHRFTSFMDIIDPEKVMFGKEHVDAEAIATSLFAKEYVMDSYLDEIGGLDFIKKVFSDDVFIDIDDFYDECDDESRPCVYLTDLDSYRQCNFNPTAKMEDCKISFDLTVPEDYEQLSGLPQHIKNRILQTKRTSVRSAKYVERAYFADFDESLSQFSDAEKELLVDGCREPLKDDL